MPRSAAAEYPPTTARAGPWSHVAVVARRLQSLNGWRRQAAAVLAGSVSILAMAPFFVWPVLFVTMPVLVWLIEGARSSGVTQASTVTPAGRRGIMSAALVGWWFGFGFHVFGLYWLREAFLVTGGALAWLWPLGVIGVPAFLGLFYAAAAGIAATTSGRVLRRVLVLALALAATEWLRGHVLTGFPWNVFGIALTWPLALMQSVSVLGIYGLTLLAVPMFALPGVILAGGHRRAGQWSPVWLALAVGVLPSVLLATWGAVRLAQPPPPTVEGVRLRLVQPSIPQRAKWQSERQAEFLRRHLALTRLGEGTLDDSTSMTLARPVYVSWSAGQQPTSPAATAASPLPPRPPQHPPGLSGITHVLWPEAAMPFHPLRYPQVLDEIGATLPEGAQLLAGILRSEADPSGGVRAYNSLAVFDESGRPIAIYDKIHLVPFGEYLPFQGLLEQIGLETLTRQRGGFAVGRSPRPLVHVAGLPPAGILICYEAIFPAAVVQTSERPGLLINVTNDGWFGNSTGPRQHLHQSRLRAVEEGLPLLRIANNGISAIFDAYGREVVGLGLDVAGVIDADLPGALPPTVYARSGDLPFLLLWLLLAGALWRRGRA